ncbi:MAG: DUF4193 family protein [Acidimicrobiales bacterium]|jgi:hypothetical protein
MDDDLDSVPEPDDLDVDDELLDGDLDVDDLDVEDDVEVVDEDIDVVEVIDDVEGEVTTDVIAEIEVPLSLLAAEEGEEEEEDDEDDDVEASLDEILKERLVVEEETNDDEPVEPEDRSEMTERVLPKQPGEFVCTSCFLVKHASQLADPVKGLCRDCV